MSKFPATLAHPATGRAAIYCRVEGGHAYHLDLDAEAGDVLKTAKAHVDAGLKFSPREHWNDGADQDDLLEFCRIGTPYRVGPAQALMDKIDADVEIGDQRMVTVASPMGSAPRVAPYLAGDPSNMWHTRHEDDPMGAVRVYIGIVSSAGVPASTLARRATAAIALAHKLGASRPVELWAVVACRYPGSTPVERADRVAFIRLGTHPVSLVHLTGVLCEAAVPRELFYADNETWGAADKLGTNGCGADWPSKPEGQHVKAHAARDGVSFIHVPPPFLDEAEAISRDPVAWVNTQYKAAMEGRGAGFTDYAAICAERDRK